LAQVIFFWLASVAFGAHLSDSQLSQCLLDLLGEFGREMRAGVLVRRRGHVDQQPGISPAQFHLGRIEETEKEIPENLVDRKRAQPPRILADVLGGLLPCLPGVTRSSSAHDSNPPASSTNWAACYPNSHIAGINPGTPAGYIISFAAWRCAVG
jgi:hypothetical protein